jgi:hypothetical protein
MTANKTVGLDNNYFFSGLRGIPDLLASSAMYGPNASGKSNFIRAISFMKKFVISSSKDYQEGDPINVVPFKFANEKQQQSSDFEMIFIQDNVRYQYGFSVTSNRVVHEWLIAYPEGRPQKWFERSYDKITDVEGWYFGPKFTGNKSLWKKSTRSNALFLSTAIQLNSDLLRPVFDWFKKIRIISSEEQLSFGYTLQQCEVKNVKQRIIEFMNAADISISDIHLTKTVFSPDLLPREMPQTIKESIMEDLKDGEVVDVTLLHPSTCGTDLIPIELKDESAGTQKLFRLAGPWIDVLENGIILFIDELDRSMHPLMVRFLVGLMHNPNMNKQKAQLVFTTHDTSILDKDFLRRDQIWFFEKSRDNSTQLYPLTDFSPRNNEALEKGYLQGRYGALPFLGGFEF